MRKTIKASYEVGSLKDLFLSEVKALKSADTFRHYELSLKRFEDFTPIENLSEKTLSQFIIELRKNELSTATINCYLRGLRVYANWAAERGMRPLKVKMISSQDEGFKCYSDEDLKKLLKRPQKKAEFGEWRQWAITAWVLATGNRAATVRAVKMKDIDWSAQEIRLRQTKNKRFQVIPLSPTLASILREFIQIWRYAAGEDDFLFCDSGEKQMSSNTLTRAVQRFNNSRGVSQTSIHALRHTFARSYLKNGGNIFMLQRLLGHSTLDMTRRYANLICEDLKEDFSSFAALDNLAERKIKRKA